MHTHKKQPVNVNIQLKASVSRLRSNWIEWMQTITGLGEEMDVEIRREEEQMTDLPFK